MRAIPAGRRKNPEGTWTKPEGPKQVNKKILPWHMGKVGAPGKQAVSAVR